MRGVAAVGSVVQAGQRQRSGRYLVDTDEPTSPLKTYPSDRPVPTGACWLVLPPGRSALVLVVFDTGLVSCRVARSSAGDDRAHPPDELFRLARKGLRDNVFERTCLPGASSFDGHEADREGERCGF